MARPIDLARWRRDRLAVELARRLKAAPNGFVRVEIDSHCRANGLTVGEWRAAARQAGRLLGWSVRTSASEQVLLLVDNRRREDLRHDAALDRWSLSWQRPPDGR
jgi:hypothetical protein